MRARKVVTTYLKYIFYRAYLWQGKIQENELWRFGVALAYVSILLSLYVFTLMTISDDFFKTALISSNKRDAVIFAAIFILVLYALPYVVLLRGSYYKKIIAEMSELHETKLQSRFRAILIFMNYIVLFILSTIFAALPNLVH